MGILSKRENSKYTQRSPSYKVPSILISMLIHEDIVPPSHCPPPPQKKRKEKKKVCTHFARLRLGREAWKIEVKSYRLEGAVMRARPRPACQQAAHCVQMLPPGGTGGNRRSAVKTGVSPSRQLNGGVDLAPWCVFGSGTYCRVHAHSNPELFTGMPLRPRQRDRQRQ